MTQVSSVMDASASALAPLPHISSASLPWFDELLHQPPSLVVNSSPYLFSMGNHSSHSVELGLGVFGSVPCDFPREVVRDALAMNLGLCNNASYSGVSVNNCEHSVHDWLLLLVAQSNAEDVLQLLIFLFFRIQAIHSLLMIFGMEKILIL